MASLEEVQVAIGKLSSDELAQIKEAIFEAEKKTTGEIVPVIVKQSDFYPAAHFRLSLLGAFVAIFSYYQLSFEGESVYFLYLFILGALIGFFLGYIAPLKMLFTTREEIEEETRQRAMESFLTNGVVETKDRNGVQLFISVLEHKVMINVDNGLHQKLGPHANDKWQHILKDLLEHLKRGQASQGICSAIKEMGAVLNEHYPADRSTLNELPNKLVIED